MGLCNMGYNTCEVCGCRVYMGECDNCESTETYFGNKFGNDYNQYSHTNQFKKDKSED